MPSTSMSEHLDDAHRILEQRALRNVRGLLDKLESEDRDRGTTDRRWIIAAAAALGIAGVGVLATCALEPRAVVVPSPTSVAPTGGTFQILRMGSTTGEFAFSGWNGDRQREVIEVDAGVAGDLKRAMMKRMILLIRTQYDGDFRWQSRRLGRQVILSARPEDNDGLEDFLMKEFFGAPAAAGEGPSVSP